MLSIIKVDRPALLQLMQEEATLDKTPTLSEVEAEFKWQLDAASPCLEANALNNNLFNPLLPQEAASKHSKAKVSESVASDNQYVHSIQIYLYFLSP